MMSKIENRRLPMHAAGRIRGRKCPNMPDFFKIVSIARTIEKMVAARATAHHGAQQRSAAHRKSDLKKRSQS
jgi:hypothetical protein